jgi:hypothetical protein
VLAFAKALRRILVEAACKKRQKWTCAWLRDE